MQPKVDLLISPFTFVGILDGFLATIGLCIRIQAVCIPRGYPFRRSATKQLGLASPIWLYETLRNRHQGRPRPFCYRCSHLR